MFKIPNHMKIYHLCFTWLLTISWFEPCPPAKCFLTYRGLLVLYTVPKAPIRLRRGDVHCLMCFSVDGKREAKCDEEERMHFVRPFTVV